MATEPAIRYIRVICPLKSHGCSTSGAPCNICGAPRNGAAGTVVARIAPEQS